MTLNPSVSLHFNGQCEAAFKFYEKCLGAKIAFMLTWGNSPMASQAPAGFANKILHGRITLGTTDIVGGDVAAEHYEQPRGFSILLSMEEPDVAERIFGELSEKGKVQLPLQKTFWAERFGSVVDQFGIAWEVNCEQPQ